MQRLSHLWLAVITISFSPMLRAAEEVNPDPKSLEITQEVTDRVELLIQQLADRSFSKREEASRELDKLGRQALPGLTSALETISDPEIQLRCEILLPRAANEDLQARLNCFLADTDGKYEHNLPSAKEFFEITGRNGNARVLFRELLSSPNRDLFLSAANDTKKMAEQILNRREELFGRMRGVVRTPITGLDIASLLFAECVVPEKEMGNNRVGSQMYSLLLNTAFRNFITDGKYKDAIEPMLIRWIETRELPLSQYYAMLLCNNTSMNLPKEMGLTAAKRVLSGGKTTSGSYKGNALSLIAKSGDKKEIKTLEKYFDDEGTCTSVFLGNNKRYTIQVRDCALAMALVLADEDPTKLGMKSRYANNNNVALRMNYTNYYFDDEDGKADENRKEAFKLYAEMKNKKEKK